VERSSEVSDISYDESSYNILVFNNADDINALIPWSFYLKEEYGNTIILYYEQSNSVEINPDVCLADMFLSVPFSGKENKELFYKKVESHNRRRGYIVELSKAMESFNDGYTQLSIDIFNRLIEQYPKYIMGYLYLMDVYYLSGDMKNAFKVIQSAVNIWPENMYFLDKLYRVLSLSGFQKESKMLMNIFRNRQAINQEMMKFCIISAIKNNQFTDIGNMLNYYHTLDDFSKDQYKKIISTGVYIHIKNFINIREFDMALHFIEQFKILFDQNNHLIKLIEYLYVKCPHKMSEIDSFFKIYERTSEQYKYVDYLISVDSSALEIRISKSMEIINQGFSTEIVYGKLVKAYEEKNDLEKVQMFNEKITELNKVGSL